MESTSMIFLGIDPSASHRPFCYVALDSDCHLQVIGQGRLEDLLAFLGGQQAACVAVNAPNLHAAAQETLFPIPPAPTNGVALRQADMELHRQGFAVRSNAAQVKRGQGLYRYLEEWGYSAYPVGEGARQVMETHAEAAYARLGEGTLYDFRSLEGRMQRQMILYNQGLRVPNPMDFLEEITPRKLAQGLLPLDQIFSPYELNAWVAAYLAWLARHKPDRIACLGNEAEGQIYLPLKAHTERA